MTTKSFTVKSTKIMIGKATNEVQIINPFGDWSYCYTRPLYTISKKDVYSSFEAKATYIVMPSVCSKLKHINLY